MGFIRYGSVALLLLAGLLARAQPARAAESYDGCAGFIDTLPATISTQGVWCLRHDLSTAIGSGNAITIAANNVTVDCNHFKLGGLAAGNGSQANGIYADARQNATVRHCNVRGFRGGILLYGGAGHLVENNRLDNNLVAGIYVYGEHNLVQRNRIYDTGGATGSANTAGITAVADVVDNVVSGLFADASGGLLVAISSVGNSTRVSGNTISGLTLTATTGGSVGFAFGISSGATPKSIANNRIFGPGTTGISGGTQNYCAGNTVVGFTNAMESCVDDGGNGLH